MPQDSTYIKQLITKSNRIETYAGTTGVNDFKYLDGQKVSPSIPYHIMYLNDGKEVYVTGADFDENKSEVIVRYSGETDYKEYVASVPKDTQDLQSNTQEKLKKDSESSSKVTLGSFLAKALQGKGKKK